MGLMRVIIDGKEKWKWNRNGVPRDTQEEAIKDGNNVPETNNRRRFRKAEETSDIDNRNNDTELSELDD